MAKIAREELFSPDEIACVHVMNRAVPRCFLMGDDPLTGENYDHRKLWLEKKLPCRLPTSELTCSALP